MSLPEDNRRFRNAIKDETLRTKLQHLWDSAEREIHPFQEGITDQGFRHCLRVERNLWSLIHEQIPKFKSLDIYLLSASAALHDIGKIKGKDAADDHGEVAAKRLLDNWKIYFRNKTEAQAVAHIVSVHSSGDMDRLPEEEFIIGNPPGVLLRSLSAIFRLADMLESDFRRCPYIARSFKELRFPHEIETWVARGSIEGWKRSNDGKKIFFQASPDNEEDRMKTLAYVDSLNNALTTSHKKYLENCQVQYWLDQELKKDTLHFPTSFSYAEHEKGVLVDKGGLILYYTQIADLYISQLRRAFSNVNLRGIGDFSEKRVTKLSSVFIDINVTLESGWAPTTYKSFGGAVDFIKRALINSSAPIIQLIEFPKLKRMVIVGEPGSGKTTICQYILLKFQSNAHKVTGIPLLVTIRDFSSAKSKKQDLTLLDYITEELTNIMERPVPPGFVEFWLSRDNTLTIMDGLDEVIKLEERTEIRNTVMDFVKEFPNGRFLVTSRIVGYDEAPLDHDNFLHLLLLRLKASQVEEYITNWYSVREANPKERKAAINGFLEALKDERVAELAQNPLLLTIMALVHRGEADLPKQRALLYGKCVEAFMVSRNRAKDLLSYEQDEVRELHEFLGYWIHVGAEEEGTSEIPFEELNDKLLEYTTPRYPKEAENRVNEFLDFARRRVGLIVERGGGLWAFGHKSFQEYFAARYISQKTFGIEELWKEINDKIERSHWVEPLKLLAGIYGFTSRKGLTVFVEKILEEYGKVDDPFHKRLILAGEIAGEVMLEEPLPKTIVDKLIEQLLVTEDAKVFNDCKRALNHFFIHKTHWKYIVNQLTERSRAFRINPYFYTGTAFFSFKTGRQFGHTRIDGVIALL